MRIAVISDTHGRVNKCIYALEKMGNIDAIIHLGDVYDDSEDISDYFTSVPVYGVNGNCGLSFRGDSERLLEISGKRFFIAHGHMYDVKRGLSAFAKKVKQVCADIGLFGHTHLCFNDIVDGIHLFNPGSASSPARGECTIGIIEITNGEFTSFEFKEI